MGNGILKDECLPNSFFRRPAEKVAPELIGCKLVKRKPSGSLLWGVIVETEAYYQSEPACHGYNNQTTKNSTLFMGPGRFYIYLTYGIYHCVNIVTDKADWASGVLLRAIAIPGEEERVASGPGLLANKFELNKEHDSSPVSIENGLWVTNRSPLISMQKIICTSRVGISKGIDLPLRWYLHSSRSVSKRAKGDKPPRPSDSWVPSLEDGP